MTADNRSTHSEPVNTIDLDQIERHSPGDLEFSTCPKSDNLMVCRWDFPHTLDYAPPMKPRKYHGLGLLLTGALKGRHQHNGGKWKNARLDEKTWIMGPAYGNGIDWRWKATCPETVPLSVIDMHLSPKTLNDVARNALGIDGEKSIELPHKLNFKDAKLESLALYIYREALNDHPHGNLFMDTAAQMLSLHLLHHHCHFKSDILKESKSKLSPDKFQKIREYIDENLDKDLSLNNLAEIASLSAYHFSREFKRSTGLPPHQYVTRIRIEKAKILLKNTTLPIEHIAYQVGIKKLSHFCALFRRIAGVTASHYRK